MIHHRPYDDAKGDFQRLWTFITQDYRDRNGHFHWTHGRISDWKYNLVTERKWVPTFLSKGAHLWLDAFDEPLGIAINEDMASTLTLLTRTSHEHLFEDMLRWATEAWAGYAQPWDAESGRRSEHEQASHGRLLVNLDEFQTREAAVLAAQGWTDLGATEITRCYDVAAKAAEPLCLGTDYRIVTLKDEPDFASKQRLYHSGWHQDKPVTDLNLRIAEYARSSPVYDPALDFSVVDARGEHVAGCVAFVDFGNGYAEIEKVCTHSAFRRLGLAEAAIRACFRELHRLGVRKAYITGENEAAVSLYGKLGAAEEWRWNTWQRILARQP